MAVGPTEVLSVSPLRYTPQQRAITARITELFMRILKGEVGGKNNPSASIPPGAHPPEVSDASPGIGSIIDLRV